MPTAKKDAPAENVEVQAAKVADALNISDEGNAIRDGELAARLKYDIEGGLGRHSEGTVIRSLSESAYTTLVNGGGHEPVAPGTKVSDAVDASAPVGT